MSDFGFLHRSPTIRYKGPAIEKKELTRTKLLSLYRVVKQPKTNATDAKVN